MQPIPMACAIAALALIGCGDVAAGAPLLDKVSHSVVGAAYHANGAVAAETEHYTSSRWTMNVNRFPSGRSTETLIDHDRLRAVEVTVGPEGKRSREFGVRRSKAGAPWQQGAKATRVAACRWLGEAGSVWSAKPVAHLEAQTACITDDGIMLWRGSGDRRTWEATSVQRGEPPSSVFMRRPSA